MNGDNTQGYFSFAPEAIDDGALPPDKITVKQNDVYRLGRHILYCQDFLATNIQPENKPILLLTDPPYGVSYADKNAFLNEFDEGNRIKTKITNDHRTSEEMYEFWKNALVKARQITHEKASFYIFGPQGTPSFFLMKSIMDSEWQLKQTLIWVKNNHVLGRTDYHYKHEAILYGWKKKSSHYFYGRTNTTSVFEHPRPLKSGLHPTMKPVGLLAKLIVNSTKQGETILDPFAGSGSTLLAAELTKRNAVCFEIEPEYCQVIIDRWEKLTKQKAEKL